MTSSPELSRLRRGLALLVTMALASGCGLSREMAPPRPPTDVDQIVGRVLRDAQPVEGMLVVLFAHTDAEPAVDSTLTTASGDYAFRNVSVGRWISRVSPTDRQDLGYVRAFFEVVDPANRIVVPDFDIHPHGLELLVPAQNVVIPRPSPDAPLLFQWSEYQLAYTLAGARVSEDGVIAWTSRRSRATAAEWTGYGNRGTYAGAPLSPGSYFWRVKLQLSPQMQAGSQLNTIILE